MKMKKRKSEVPARFSGFQAETALSEDIFVKLEKEGRVELTREQREGVQLALQRFEYTSKYEKQGRDEPRRVALKSLVPALDQAAALAQSLRGPPDLWRYIAAKAGIDYEDAPTLLKKLAAVARSTSEEVEAARRKRGPDMATRALLLELERQYLITAKHKTGVTNRCGRRGGPFVRFCDTALGALPAAIPRKRSIGAIWEKIAAERARGEHAAGNRQHAPRRSRRIWVGKVTTAQLRT